MRTSLLARQKKAFVIFTGLQPIKPKFKKNSPQYLTLNKPGWIHCKVVSDPRAKLFWTKTLQWPSGEHLSNLEFLPFSNGSLFVMKAKKSYEGDFYCTAVNSGGFKIQNITIKVGGKNNSSNNRKTRWPCGKRAGLRIERSGFEPWLVHCVVLLGKTLYSHSASLHPGV